MMVETAGPQKLALGEEIEASLASGKLTARVTGRK